MNRLSVLLLMLGIFLLSHAQVPNDACGNDAEKKHAVVMGKVCDYDASTVDCDVVACLFSEWKNKYEGGFGGHVKSSIVNPKGEFCLDMELAAPLFTALCYKSKTMRPVLMLINPGDTICIDFSQNGKVVSSRRNGLDYAVTDADSVNDLRYDFLRSKGDDAEFMREIDSLALHFDICRERENAEPAYSDYLRDWMKVRLAEFCCIHDRENKVSLLDSASMARWFVSRYRFDDEKLLSDAEFPYLVNEMHHLLGDKFSYYAKENLLKDYAMRGERAMTVLEQCMMISLLSELNGNSAEEIDSLRMTNEECFSSSVMKKAWNNACDALLAKEKDRRLVPGFISDHTISSILKDNKSKYVEIIFLLPDAKANKLLFFSDNIRRDFRDSESLSIVYCGIASNDAEREMLSGLNRRYPEETFLYISKADYV
ncbi:MAG: hypothetical protein KBT29_00275, partial [Prevotellaceae bacterium]|nr:hypothetical protein [Candidatus Minthosoma caballi]